jgi:acyl-CoA reductase-like NAD-dependent aldehyde dehydrogenase
VFKARIKPHSAQKEPTAEKRWRRNTWQTRAAMFPQPRRLCAAQTKELAALLVASTPAPLRLVGGEANAFPVPLAVLSARTGSANGEFIK